MEHDISARQEMRRFENLEIREIESSKVREFENSKIRRFEDLEIWKWNAALTERWVLMARVIVLINADRKKKI